VLTRDELAAVLDQSRAQVIAEKRRAFPTLTWQDFEDLYSDASVDALRREFVDADALRAYLRQYLHNRAITLKRSPRVSRTVGSLTELHADAGPGPYEQVVEHEWIALLQEFLAEQTVRDRNIVWMLASGQRPSQIAHTLGLSRGEATNDCKRLRSSLERFVALRTRPAAICARRREDVLSWQATGRMPLALRWHLRWHQACGLVELNARQAVQQALVPLVPAAEQLRHVGLLQRVYQGIATHRFTAAGHDAMARVRRFSPAGGGSAVAGAGAVKAVALIGASAVAFHALTAAPPSHHGHAHHRARVVARAAGDTTTDQPTVPSTPTTAAIPPPESVSTSTSATAPTESTSSTPAASTTTTVATTAAPDAAASTPPASADSGSADPGNATASAAAADSSSANESTASAAPAPRQDADAASSPTGASGSGNPTRRENGVQGTSSSLGGGGTPP
jgi:DNA-directed RNA polymerase specialized sigma24 family protein